MTLHYYICIIVIQFIIYSNISSYSDNSILRPSLLMCSHTGRNIYIYFYTLLVSVKLIIKFNNKGMLARSKSQGVNLRYLKKGIDIKIQAILRYLHRDDALPNQVQQLVGNQLQLQKKEPNRQSMNTDVGSEINCAERSEIFDSGSMDIISKQKISLAQYLQKQRRQSEENQGQIGRENLTPVRSSGRQKVEKSSSSNSEQSASKRNIEAYANYKIFGAPLTESFNANNLPTSPNLFTIKIQHIQVLKHRSGHSTSRSIKSRRNKQNSGVETPTASLSRQKSITNLKRTPSRTPYSNHYSATKRLYEYFSGLDRPFKPITQSTLKQMEEEIEQLYKQTRKQGQDNNVRARLLKRIECSKLKTNQFLPTK